MKYNIIIHKIIIYSLASIVRCNVSSVRLIEYFSQTKQKQRILAHVQYISEEISFYIADTRCVPLLKVPKSNHIVSAHRF